MECVQEGKGLLGKDRFGMVPATIALQPIKAVRRSGLMLKSEIIKKVFFVVSTIVAMNFGVFTIALTVPANTLLDLNINGIINKKIINYNLIEELSDCLQHWYLPKILNANGLIALLRFFL